MLHDFENILMDSIKTAAESTWNGTPPLSVQASGVWGGLRKEQSCVVRRDMGSSVVCLGCDWDP